MTDAAGPDDGEALKALAQQHEAAGQAAEAFAAWRTLAGRDPGEAAAYAGAARLLEQRGDFGQAAQVLSKGLAEAREPGRTALLATPMARLLAGLNATEWNARLEADLLACLEASSVDPQALANAAARLLRLKHPEGPRQDDLIGDRLWRAFLTRCLNTDPDIEARLIFHRRRALERGAPEDVLAALALQAFAGEYAWPVDEDEAAMVAALGDDGDGPLRRAMYERPDALAGEGELVRLLARRAIEEPAEEAALAASVERLGESEPDDPVRRQYEQNPYPRWRTPPAPARASFFAGVRSLPGVDAARLPSGGRVLIAGCGTGYEPIDLARTDPSLEITAMDLSAASLGYARRMAGELGLDRIRFVQGDLHGAASLGRFDAVTSTGVLHHLADPALGLKALVAATAPGGVIRLGLYSRRARRRVEAARTEIERLGLAPTPDGIRAFRAHVLALPDDAPLAGLTQSADFYSLSGCRDLVFHARETDYTPIEVGDLLAGAGVRLVGFEAAPEAEARFTSALGAGADRLDLSLWDRLEQAHPDLFAGMYHLWAQTEGRA